MMRVKRFSKSECLPDKQENYYTGTIMSIDRRFVEYGEYDTEK